MGTLFDVIHKSTEDAHVKPSQSPPASKPEETKVDEPHTSEPTPETSQESAQENVGGSDTNDEPVSALVVVPEEKLPKKERKKRAKRPPTTEPWRRFSCECSIALVDKLHNICSKENVSLRSLVEKMFRDGIRSYERKHGVAEGASKRTAEDLY